MTFDSFLHKIQEIKNTLPLGVEAQALMVPKERIPYLYAEDFLEHHPKRSAVMMLLFPKGEEISLLLIERATYKGVHSGQVAFPGGKYEDSDLNLERTALRETMEEVGILPKDIEVIKPFTTVYIPPSNFIVQPYLGIVKDTPRIIPSVDEVANTIAIPLHALLDDTLIQQVPMTTSYAQSISVPAYVYEGYQIWGATAMMISELKETLKLVF
ncbi:MULTISPECIES: NUDIX hydrolase [Myroides]|uniref:NUDIX domain-containing protein n=1 Tax=Myroides albus TaxID=2562892 RepID=A0A6I3LM82_9FLAO|nr:MULTISPECIES: CoA pyrophosphatase [Myroides]MTG98974.1 NUDIX domain-containing protein [Myroides albus]MVX37334.1 NUDIX domain-containing protein [Myroides sp. LoEW2-1]UVD80235.1 CoA pyrophosphatase [Myroides albus]